MNILLPEHQDFAKKLIDAKVQFIIIGGYAVIFHGYGRTTGDMDVWLKPDNENKEKLLIVLKEYGILKEDIEFLQGKDFSAHLAFHMGTAPRKIDFLTKISGVNYEEADKIKESFDADEYKIPVIHYNHLISSKLVSNRAKDKADVEELQKINYLRKKRK